MKKILFGVCLLVAAGMQAADAKWALRNVPENCRFNGFHDGMAVCYDTVANKYGAIGTSGELIIPLEYAYLSDFNGDGAVVETAQGQGIINDANQFILAPKAEWKISPILKNSFLVVNESAQTQAIFYRDKLITDFVPVHSIAYDVQFPFIRIDVNTIINTETDELISSIYDMGSYFLTENTKGDISAISRFTGEDWTASIIGDDVFLTEVRNATNAMLKDPFMANSTDQTVETSMQNYKEQFCCVLTHENGLWKMATRNGDVKFSLKDEEGWTCKMPFYQNNLVWFERNIPNTDSTQIKVVYISGIEYFTRTVRGSARLKFYPTYWRIMGHTLVYHSVPHICLTEVSPEGIETRTTIECIIRGATMLAKAKAAQNKKFSSYTFDGGEYVICGNYLIYKGAESWIVYDIEHNKEYPAKEIVDYSEDEILAIDPADQYFVIQTETGKKTALAKFQHVEAFNEGMAIAETKAGKAIIDQQGKILLQESKDLAFVSTQSSEDVIVARNNKTNRMSFIYNPLVQDTLIYNSADKVEQLYAKGISYYEKKQYRKAKECFDRLCKHNPKHVAAIVKYADCLTAQRYYALAIRHYNKALAIDPYNQDAAEHMEWALQKKEQAEYAAEVTRAICGAIYDGLSAANDAISSSSSSCSQSSSTSGNTSVSSGNSKSGEKGSYRNDSNYRNAQMRTYADYENQLSKMNTYPDRYNDRERVYIQSQMRSIRTELERRGYKQRKSEWEDWDGTKR